MVFRILHVDDSPDCNFLLTETFRKDQHIKIDWGSTEPIVMDRLASAYPPFDLIICDGEIPGWPRHFEDVLKASKGSPVIVYSAFARRRMWEFLELGAEKIFSKGREDHALMVEYIRGLADCKNPK